MNSRTWGLLAVLLLSASCGKEGPKPILPADRFEAVYASLLEETGGLRHVPADSSRQFDPDSIFRSFGTSEQTFRSTVEAYRANPGKWRDFFEGVIKRLNEKQKVPQERPRS